MLVHFQDSYLHLADDNLTSLQLIVVDVKKSSRPISLRRTAVLDMNFVGTKELLSILPIFGKVIPPIYFDFRSTAKFTNSIFFQLNN